MYLGRGGYLDPSVCGHFVDHLGGPCVEAYRVDGPFTEMELGSGRSTNSPPDPFKSNGPEEGLLTPFSPSTALAVRGIGLLSPFSTPKAPTALVSSSTDDEQSRECRGDSPSCLGSSLRGQMVCSS